MKRMGIRPRLFQGENGCPSEPTEKFALSDYPWTELSQAKWDLRRYLGDFCTGVRSSVFTICDFNHKGREINLKGLLRADEDHNVIAVKRAYYAVQNVVSVFDGTLSRVKDSGFGTKDWTLSTYEYRKPNGKRLFVFWTHAEKAAADGTPEYLRPGDSFETRPAVFRDAGGEPLAAPVWVDLLTGHVYDFPKENIVPCRECVRYLDVPVYDSPCALTERDVLDAMT